LGTYVTGKMGAGGGAILGGAFEGVGAVPGAIGGYLIGTFGASIYYDVEIGPKYVKPWMHEFISGLH